MNARDLVPVWRVMGGCHWLTWGTATCMATVLVVIVVPGEYYDAIRSDEQTAWRDRCEELYRSTYESHRQSVAGTTWPHVTVHLYQHGWPWPFLARTLVRKQVNGKAYRERSEPLVQVASYFRHWGGSVNHSASWSNYDNWPLTADSWHVRYIALVADLAVAVGLLTLVGGSVQWRQRRRGRVLSFGLSDLLAMVTVLGLALGYYAWHTQVQRIEGHGLSRPLPPAFVTHNRGMTSGQDYHGPVWLRKLVGNAYFLPWLHHVENVSIGPGERMLEAYETLPRLPYLRSVGVGRTLPLAALAPLARCPRLSELELPHLSPAPPPGEFGLRDLPRLEPLRLTSLKLFGESLEARHLRQVAKFTTLRRLTLQDVSATPDEIAQIRQEHPQLEIVVKPSFKMFLSP